MIKTIYKNPTAMIIFISEKPEAFPIKIRNKVRFPPLTAGFQYHAGSLANAIRQEKETKVSNLRRNK